MAGKRFKATLFEHPASTACGIEIPFDPKEAFGKVRAPVNVTIKGFTFRTTVFRMSGQCWIPVNKGNREGAGIVAGEGITVHMELDTAARVITPPPDLRKKLRGHVKTAWDKLSYTRQCEFSIRSAEIFCWVFISLLPCLDLVGLHQ